MTAGRCQAASTAAMPAAGRLRRRRVVRWQRSARPQQPALAEHARSLPRLAVRGHAAADAGGHGARTTTRASCSAFPTCAALAAAPLDDVLAPVERPGLLQPRAQPAPLRAGRGGAARRRVSAHAPQLLQTLPGIGRSTAAAIASFCFGERAAILDGNVKRVLTRVLAFGDDLAVSAPTSARCGTHATACCRSATCTRPCRATRRA